MEGVMGCAGCDFCGKPGYVQAHVTVAGPDATRLPQSNGWKPILIDNLWPTMGHHKREVIWTRAHGGSVSQGKAWAEFWGGGFRGAEGYDIKIVRRKVEIHPHHPDLFLDTTERMYREAHFEVPYSLDYWHLAKEHGLAASVNAGKAPGIRPLLLTRRWYHKGNWDVEVKRLTSILKPLAVREEVTVWDTDRHFDKDWLTAWS